jgi:transposase
MNRGDLTNEQWEQLKVVLPPQKQRTGRPALDHRQVMNGILWVLRTGAPWRDLPERYGKWATIYSRFRRWREQGVWDEILSKLQSIKSREPGIDWELHFIDASVVRAHRHAAGAKKAP